MLLDDFLCGCSDVYRSLLELMAQFLGYPNVHCIMFLFFCEIIHSCLIEIHIFFFGSQNERCRMSSGILVD